MDELKPCPLCGDEVVIDKEGVYCDCCHLVLRFDDYIYNGEAKDWEEAREIGIEAWNSRPNVIKEFAERLCDGKVSNDPVVIAVKCAVKEMTEE